MSDTKNDDTDDTDEPRDYYRNEPASTFEAHLFGAGEVEQAGGGHGDKTDRPVPSLCSRSTSYGPFYRVEDVSDLEKANGENGDRNGTCAVCLEQVRTDEDADEVDA